MVSILFLLGILLVFYWYSTGILFFTRYDYIDRKLAPAEAVIPERRALIMAGQVRETRGQTDWERHR